jgi:hypothetical protein
MDGFEIHATHLKCSVVRRGHPSASSNAKVIAASTSLAAIKAAWSLLVPDRPFPETPINGGV